MHDHLRTRSVVLVKKESEFEDQCYLECGSITVTHLAREPN